MKPKSSKEMYKDSPKVDKGKDGKPAVNKGPTEAEKVANKENGQQGGQPVTEEAMPMPVRHSMERHTMHGKHEHEHAMHESGKHGDKKEMHARHQTEMKAMHKMHEKQSAMGGDDDAAGGSPQPVAGE